MNLYKESPFTDNKDLKFFDTITELRRVYIFPSGAEVVIQKPVAVCPGGKFREYGGGGHRIVDSEGTAHYIPAGWIHLYWEVGPDDKPFCF